MAVMCVPVISLHIDACYLISCQLRACLSYPWLPCSVHFACLSSSCQTDNHLSFAYRTCHLLASHTDSCHSRACHLFDSHTDSCHSLALLPTIFIPCCHSLVSRIFRSFRLPLTLIKSYKCCRLLYSLCHSNVIIFFDEIIISLL
jgi:hypothetical protein